MRMQGEGPTARGQPKQRQKILQKVEEKYAGFGPTLAAEHLGLDDRLAVNPETLRRWMLSAGLWKRARQRQQHRRRRERRAHFGELVRMDGSFHDWYQGGAGKACLMNMVDDATSTVEAGLGEGETIWAEATGYGRKKGDTSNEGRWGTFLKWVDSQAPIPVVSFCSCPVLLTR